MRSRLPCWLVALLLYACGARTGLDVEPSDGGAARRDAGFFATFPCRWSLGLPIDLARSDEELRELTGAVHPTLDEALVRAVSRDGRPVGARVTIDGAPERLRELPADALPTGALFTGDTGWAVQNGAACMLTGLSTALEPRGATRWGSATPVSTCRLHQSHVGRVMGVSVLDFGTGEVHEVGAVDGDAPTVALRASVAEELDEATAFFDPDEDTAMVLTRVASVATVERHRRGRVERYALPGEVFAASAAIDRLRGGILVLYGSLDAGWSLDWVPIDADPPQRLIELGALPAEPVGPLASNETEALIPLANGQMAYVPLALSELRLLEAVDGGAVREMHIVLRPATSGGGLLFTQSGAGGERLRFQPLVCNR